MQDIEVWLRHVNCECAILKCFARCFRMACRLLLRLTRSNCSTCCRRTFGVSASCASTSEPRVVFDKVARSPDGSVDWNSISESVKAGTSLSSYEEASQPLRETLSLATESVCSSSDPRTTLPIALRLAEFCRAPSDIVEQLYSTVDRSRTNFSFEDIFRVLGPLNGVSKVYAAPSHTVLKPLYDSISRDLHEHRSLLTDNNGANLRTLCQCLVTFHTFHREILGELVDFLQQTLQKPGSKEILTDFNLAADCVYAISFLRKSAPPLFERLLGELDDLNYIDYYSFEQACKLNWAFLAQGVDKPQSTMKVFMRRLYEHLKTKRLDLSYLSELSQVVESFREVVAMEEVNQVIAATHIAKSPSVALMRKLGHLKDGQLVAVEVPSQTGFVPVASLVSRENGELVRFPRNAVPEQMTARLPESLGVWATCLMLLPDNQFLNPLDDVSGVIKRQILRMKTLGWHVSTLRLSDMEDLQGEELDSVVEQSLKEAVADSQRKWERAQQAK